MKYIFLMFLLLSACAQNHKIDSMKPLSSSEAQSRRNFMVGKWYGEAQTKDGFLRKSLMHRRADGTFTVQFQLYQANELKLDQTEAGIWGLVDNIYFTATREMLNVKDFAPVDTTDATYYDVYNVIYLDENRMEYKQISSDNSFNIKKVADNFKLNKK